uniref:Uncharacterized protein n=1 Tax=Trichobilharzia regenti TaxID=157069 RepID=A0AA85J3T7_TRIRE|nr:unnamed protein product [Trichobilharzia regenti]
MDAKYIVAIVGGPFFVALITILLLRFKLKFLVVCVLTAILLSLSSACIVLAVCENVKLNEAIGCPILIAFTVLEDVLTIIFIFLTKRLNLKVVIVLWSLSLASLVTATVLIVVGCDEDVCAVLEGGFFNSLLSLITVIFADLLK